MSGSMRVYRGLLRFYPHRFRDEYGHDMALLFSDQFRDESAIRVWGRVLVDLAITLPAQHLEAHMERPPTPTVPILFAATSITGVTFAIVAGSTPRIAAFGLAIAAVAGALAVASWRYARDLTTARSASARWWQILLAGVGTLASTIAVLNLVGEVADEWWEAMLIALLGGILLTAAGLVLGIAHLTSSRHRTALTEP